MRRVEAAKAMENQTAGLKFFTKMNSVPMVSMFSNKLTDMYTKSKTQTGPLGRMLQYAESAAVTAAGVVVVPLANTLSVPLSKIDDAACKGLDMFEKKVPVVTKQPDEIVNDTRELITAKVTPAVKVFNDASDVVCNVFVVQKSFDCMEYMVKVAYTTMDKVLPPGEMEKPEQNGISEGEIQGSARPGRLVRNVWNLFSTGSRRILGVAQQRVDNAAATTDMVIKNAQKAFSRPTNTS